MTTPTKDLAGLGRLYWSLNDRRRFPTPQVTVEALMFSLRSRGTAALTEPDWRRRLSGLCEAQLLEVAVRLQKLKPEIAPAWTEEQIKTLVKTKAAL
jgi:hypothetical protein